MPAARKDPRLLIVTPEITYLPEGMGNMANYLTAKAGGLADVSAALVSSLYGRGVDVHVALPNYRTMFNRNIGRFINRQLDIYRSKLPTDRIHLAEDRCFYYRDSVYHNTAVENFKLATAFQREVINNILPMVQPDLIHCNDWMTGIIPAVAKRLGIPCLFTVHNIHSMKATLADIEDTGVDAAQFWPYLYYDHPPLNYEETREGNTCDFLLSGIFSSTYVNTVSPTFLKEIVRGQHSFVAKSVQQEFAAKFERGYARGILNSPDPHFDPTKDEHLIKPYGPNSHFEGKKLNKLALQRYLGLVEDEDAPLFFWPSRLDPVQKGCQLLADVFYDILSRYARERLQIAVIANGPFKDTLVDLVRKADMHRRVSVTAFEERLSHLGYAAADFLFMPSSFEPCGLPQMIGPIYGTLPIAHDTGGIHDTVRHLSVEKSQGNGFLFEIHDAMGFRWGVDQAMKFFKLAPETKFKEIRRIMTEGKKQFNQAHTAERYMEIYRLLLGLPQKGDPEG
ncbi:Glycogen/starch synthase [Sulfidibacter corallicola]|uniref:starch synthase n=1 Tax=Sulfidibacter corallicola TaxID=2818388 RepID=A0A8A4TGI5_SULCO|nr:glycogen/starch synthase [Sulfidibacter corallicola]QTD47901.1 glycogen/starch synthase [Sulfidibacter corallicola]